MAVQSRANDDRRRGERHSINPEFAALDPGTLTYVSNLSEYGVFIHTRVRLPVGAAVDLRFTVLLDDPVVIHGPGRVVHHQDEPRGMGVVFTKLSAEMQLRVIDAIAWYRAREGTAEAGDQVFRTRELTPEELAQIDEGEDGDESDEATGEASDDPAAESVTSLSTSDMVAESGDHLAYLNASIEELSPEDVAAATAAHAASKGRAAAKPPATPPAPAAPPAPAPPLKDDEYEDF